MSSRAGAGDLWEATWMHSGTLFTSFHVTAGRWSPRSGRLRGGSSPSLCVMHCEFYALPWARCRCHLSHCEAETGSVGAEVWKKLSAQNVGQQVPTPAQLCCPEALTLAFSEEPADFPLGWGENFRASCQLLFSVFSWYSCFWAHVQLFFHCWIHLVWLLQQNLPTGINTHLSYL